MKNKIALWIKWQDFFVGAIISQLCNFRQVPLGHWASVSPSARGSIFPASRSMKMGVLNYEVIVIIAGVMGWEPLVLICVLWWGHRVSVCSYTEKHKRWIWGYFSSSTFWNPQLWISTSNARNLRLMSVTVSSFITKLQNNSFLKMSDPWLRIRRPCKEEPIEK